MMCSIIISHIRENPYLNLEFYNNVEYIGVALEMRHPKNHNVEEYIGIAIEMRYPKNDPFNTPSNLRNEITFHVHHLPTHSRSTYQKSTEENN